MRILVTGCHGYVGHQVAIRLARAGFTVLGSARRAGAIAAVEVVVGDHADERFVERIVDRVDAVIHFAARTRGHSAEIFRRDNEAMTRRFSQAATRLKRRFIYISSDQAVYQTGHYGRSKRACEEIVAADASEYAIVRLSAVLGRYAPGMASTFSRIIQRLHQSRFIAIPGDGSEPVAPVWIGDVELVLRAFLSMPRLPNDGFELCGPVITLGTLIDLFEARLGVRRTRLRLPLGFLQAMARRMKPHSIFSRLPLDALLDLGSPVQVSAERLGSLMNFVPTTMAQAVPLIENFPEPDG